MPPSFSVASFSVTTAPRPSSTRRCRHGSRGRKSKGARTTCSSALLECASTSTSSCSLLASLAALPSTSYSPSPPGPEIWLGALAPTLVFLLGSYEFAKRILIQRRCAVCSGTGLVSVPLNGDSSSSSSTPQFRKVKCRACGGFFPWESAERFFSATARPGNGGPLQQPSFPKQTSVLYRVPSVEEAARAAEEMRARKERDDSDSSDRSEG